MDGEILDNWCLRIRKNKQAYIIDGLNCAKQFPFICEKKGSRCYWPLQIKPMSKRSLRPRQIPLSTMQNGICEVTVLFCNDFLQIPHPQILPLSATPSCSCFTPPLCTKRTLYNNSGLFRAIVIKRSHCWRCAYHTPT